MVVGLVVVVVVGLVVAVVGAVVGVVGWTWSSSVDRGRSVAWSVVERGRDLEVSGVTVVGPGAAALDTVRVMSRSLALASRPARITCG